MGCEKTPNSSSPKLLSSDNRQLKTSLTKHKTIFDKGRGKNLLVLQPPNPLIFGWPNPAVILSFDRISRFVDSDIISASFGSTCFFCFLNFYLLRWSSFFFLSFGDRFLIEGIGFFLMRCGFVYVNVYVKVRVSKLLCKSIVRWVMHMEYSVKSSVQNRHFWKL